MWPKRYRDYPKDKPLQKFPSKLIGCQMNELNGWGEEYENHPPYTSSLWSEITEKQKQQTDLKDVEKNI